MKKKVKVISVFVLMLAVVALGLFMGKQFFKMLEAGAVSQNNTDSKPTLTENNSSATVKILYSSSSKPNVSIPKPKIIGKQLNECTTAELKKTADDKKEIKNKKQVLKFVPGGPKWLAYASAKGVNVRKGPSIKFKKLFKVAKGTRGKVLEQKNGWTKIKWDFNKKIGWVRNDLLVVGPANVMLSLVKKTSDIDKITSEQIKSGEVKQILKKNKIAVAIAKPAPVSETVKGYKKGDKLPEYGKIIANPAANIRNGPSTKNARIAKLPTGVVVKIKSVVQTGKWQWFEIIFNNGRKTGWTREDNLSF